LADEVAHFYFTGQRTDDESGLMYYGARYYDPDVGRFITPDTIVQAPDNPQTLNRYAYAGNNPVNNIDPTGHFSWNKFWNSFAGAVVGVTAAVLLGPAGVGATMAGVIGGAAGGAITGGLNGGWQGALTGAVLGGGLGGIGGWGVAKYGSKFGAGMLIAGAGAAGATDSWDSFAGGLTGGLTGWLVGNGVSDAYHKNLAYTDPNGGIKDAKVVEGRGVGTTPGKALDVANKTGRRVLYTPSRNVGSDIVRGGTQLLFRNSLASRNFAGYLLSNPNTTYNLHSEMTLTALGAAEMIAASGVQVTGVHFNLVSPFYSEATANSVFGAIGATIKYFPPNLADSAGMFATFTPLTAPIYGTLGILTLEHFHSYEVYQSQFGN
jgi:RHS repeat-associated protein